MMRFRINRDAECEKHKRPEELKVDELMEEAEAAGGTVAEDLLVNVDNIVDVQTFEEETSDANREDADKEHDEGKRKIDSGEEKQNQDNKRRRLQLLASEKKLVDKFLEGCLHSPSRHDLNRILSALEFGPTTKDDCTIDASGIINAVQGADESPHDEDAEMKCWRMMHEGMEFWDDVNDWKPLNLELAVQARQLEMGRWVCTRKYLETLPRRWVARSSPQNGWTRTRVIRPGQTIEAGSLVARRSTTEDSISFRRLHHWRR